MTSLPAIDQWLTLRCLFVHFSRSFSWIQHYCDVCARARSVAVLCFHLSLAMLVCTNNVGKSRYKARAQAARQTSPERGKYAEHACTITLAARHPSRRRCKRSRGPSWNFHRTRNTRQPPTQPDIAATAVPTLYCVRTREISVFKVGDTSPHAFMYNHGE